MTSPIPNFTKIGHYKTFPKAIKSGVLMLTLTVAYSVCPNAIKNVKPKASAFKVYTSLNRLALRDTPYYAKRTSPN